MDLPRDLRRDLLDDGLTSEFGQPGGAYLLAVVEEDGLTLGPSQRSWIAAPQARNAGLDPDHLRSLGAEVDQLRRPEAVRLVGLTKQYLRGLARHHEGHRDEIERSIAAGRHPRRAFLVAHRGTKDDGWSPESTWPSSSTDGDHHRSAVRCTTSPSRLTSHSASLPCSATPRHATPSSVRLRPGTTWRSTGSRTGPSAASTARPSPPKDSPWRRSATSPPERWTRSRITTTSSSTPLGWRTAATGACGPAHYSPTPMLPLRWRRPRCATTSPGASASAGVRAGRAAGRSAASTTPLCGSSPNAATRSTRHSESSKLRSGRGAHPSEIEHIVLRTRPAKNRTPVDDLVASWRGRGRPPRPHNRRPRSAHRP